MSETAVESETAMRRLSTEFWAIVSVGLVVLGQAAWLDAKIEQGDARLEHKIEQSDARLEHKIEQGDARLEHKIETLQLGQAAIRERLAALEAISARALRPQAVNDVGMNTDPAS